MRDDRHDVEGLIAVDGVWSLFEVVEDASDGLKARDDFGISVVDDLSETVGSDSLDRVVLEELVSPSDESTGTGVGEEFLLETIGGYDGYAGGTGEVVEEFLDFPKLELGAVLDPGLLHQALVFLSQTLVPR